MADEAGHDAALLFGDFDRRIYVGSFVRERLFGAHFGDEQNAGKLGVVGGDGRLEALDGGGAGRRVRSEKRRTSLFGSMGDLATTLSDLLLLAANSKFNRLLRDEIRPFGDARRAARQLVVVGAVRVAEFAANGRLRTARRKDSRLTDLQKR